MLKNKQLQLKFSCYGKKIVLGGFWRKYLKSIHTRFIHIIVCVISRILREKVTPNTSKVKKK